MGASSLSNKAKGACKQEGIYCKGEAPLLPPFPSDWWRMSHDGGWQVALHSNEGFPLCFQCGRSFTMAAILGASHWFIPPHICLLLPLMEWGNTRSYLLMSSDMS